MRRPGRKHGIHSNRGIKKCPSCSYHYSKTIDEKVAARLAQEEAIEAEETVRKAAAADPRANERKRLARKAPATEAEVEKATPVKRTKKKEKMAQWKKVTKEFVIQTYRAAGAAIVGNIAHRYAVIEPSRYHGTDDRQEQKGSHKHPDPVVYAYRDRNAEDSLAILDAC